MSIRLIVNADDLGHTEGISLGIEAAHRNGIVTSASLMVNRPATQSGVEVALRNPQLSVGLHFNLTDENPDAVDLNNLAWVESELRAQFALFRKLMGRKVSHLDTHHHIHWNSNLSALFQDFAAKQQVPLRHYGKIRYEGGFYGQWEDGVVDFSHIDVPFMCGLLRKLPPGLSELACHPGYVTPELDSIYRVEREEEIRTLTSPEVKECLREIGAQLCNFTSCE